MVIESCFSWVSCLGEFVYELSDVLLSLCLSCYVFHVWETSDIFLGTLDYCLLHQSIRWWFDCSSCLDLSKLVFIHFPSIYLFFSWYLICLAYIILCSYRFTFYVQYFLHIILMHLIDDSIFFFSLLSLIYSSYIISSSPIYSYWTTLGPWLMRFFVHVAFYTRGYEILSLGF